MFCNNCGKEISDNSEFCQFCGTKNKKNFSGKDKQSVTGKWWFIVLMLSFVYPFGMFLMWSKKKFNLFFRIALSVFFFFVFIGVVSGVISGSSENNTTVVQVETKVAETTKPIETTKKTETKETINVEENKVNGSNLIADDNTINETKNKEEKIEKNDFIDKIKNIIDGAIGDNEKYNEIKFTNKNIYISVDLSNASELYSGYKKDLAISRIESITDDILKLKDYFNEWDSIIVDFGDIGSILLDKTQIVTNPYGMMYFDFTDDMLNTNKKDLNSVSKDIDISNFNTKPLEKVDKNKLKLHFGEILEANGFYGDIIVIKAKYTPALSKQDKIEQGNFMNVEDLIKNQGLDNASEIKYWAVADMTSGDESKYISFDIPSDLILDIKKGRILPKEFFNRVKNYWLLPSIKNQ